MKKSILLTLLPPLIVPPAMTTLVVSAFGAACSLAVFKSPKSVAFPAVAIVTKSVIFVPPYGEEASTIPPANKPLVSFPAPAPLLLAEVVSPKSVPFD